MSSRTPRATLVALHERDGVVRCVMTATEGDQNVPQHRQGGMGGRPEKHRPCNVLWINSILNGLIESSAKHQDVAKAWGVKVPVWVDDVSRVPVYYRFENAWYVLTDVTRRRIAALEALDMMLDVYGDEYLEWKATADEHFGMLLRGRF